MPRVARKDIETPYIHVMVQGINKEYIFDEEKYLKKYLYLMLNSINPQAFELLAYCMMNNHAHFLFWVDDFPKFSEYMHKNNQKFAQDYNEDKNRCGVIFRNRYQAEPINNERYLINCIKYIHYNPVKANIVDKCEDYKYSSYNDYVNNTGVADSRILKSLYGPNCNYKTLFNDAFDRRFIDTGSDSNDLDYIYSGINEFRRRYSYDLVDILSSRDILSKLIIFLKSECNVTYKEVETFFGFSKPLMFSLIKGKM
jgi:REP element-mobilizing transposase RayT